MDAVRQQVTQLRDGWKTVYDMLLANPNVAAPHLEAISAEQINEVIDGVVWWLDRAKAPKGFAPRFHLAKSVASTSLSTALTALRNVQAGQYNHLPTLVTALNQVTSALHSLVASSDPDEARQHIASLGVEMSEKLALLDTAQRELKEKVEALQEASKVAEEITAKGQAIQQSHDSVVATVERITATQTKADEILEAIREDEDATSKLKDAATEIEKRNANLATEIEEKSETLANLQTESQKQSELIASLLPQAASAGLASSFAGRVRQLEWTKWMWMGIFIVTVLGLAVFAWQIVKIPQANTEQIWSHVLHRLPLASPLIWLAWFSAIQYGNTLRVQEDYAFKEATSKAFEGYRRHMEHLSSVDLKEGNTAMTMLSAKTIHILGHEPLRILAKSERDVSPTHALAELLSARAAAVKTHLFQEIEERAKVTQPAKYFFFNSFENCGREISLVLNRASAKQILRFNDTHRDSTRNET